LKKPIGVIFEEYNTKEISNSDYQKLRFCYPKRYRYAYFNKWLKEVNKLKKIRPYLELKVVKAKKEKKKWIGEVYINGKCRPLYEKDHYIYFVGEEKKKGNWVNGENLDKIKFPALCSYDDYGYREYGVLNKTVRGTKDLYELHRIEQKEFMTYSAVTHSFSLERLIKKKDIHILKGKVIIFEEE